MFCLKIKPGNKDQKKSIEQKKIFIRISRKYRWSFLFSSSPVRNADVGEHNPNDLRESTGIYPVSRRWISTRLRQFTSGGFHECSSSKRRSSPESRITITRHKNGRVNIKQFLNSRQVPSPHPNASTRKITGELSYSRWQ